MGSNSPSVVFSPHFISFFLGMYFFSEWQVDMCREVVWTSNSEVAWCALSWFEFSQLVCYRDILYQVLIKGLQGIKLSVSRHRLGLSNLES